MKSRTVEAMAASPADKSLANAIKASSHAACIVHPPATIPEIPAKTASRRDGSKAGLAFCSIPSNAASTKNGLHKPAFAFLPLCEHGGEPTLQHPVVEAGADVAVCRTLNAVSQLMM
jgi:hypothetical protein